MHARQLIHEILQLPPKHLSSLANISASTSQLILHTAQLYLLSGLTNTQVERLTQELLVDPVVQDAAIMASEVAQASTDYIIDVFFHAGVTDTLAESVQAGAQMLGISGLEHVETGRRYILDSRLSEDDVHSIAQALLYNPVIQEYILYPTGSNRQPANAQSSPTSDLYPKGHRSPSVGGAAIYDARPSQTNDCAHSSHANAITRTIFISDMNDEQLLEVSKTGLLALDLEEMRTIQQHYKSQGREPTDVELETTSPNLVGALLT